MMRKLATLAAMTFCIAAGVSHAQPANVFHRSYGDYCRADMAEESYMQAYQPRCYNYAGLIEVEYDSTLPAEMIACIRIATDAVEQNILTETPLRVKIEFKHFEPVTEGDVSYAQLTETEVRYVYDETDNVCYPSSLYRQKYATTTDEVIYDGTIYLSEDEPWNFTQNTKKNLGNKHDLTTYLMRAYMRILGIGSAIDRADEGAIMSLPALTPYDRVVYLWTPGDVEPIKTPLSSLNLSKEEANNEVSKLILSSPVAMLPDGFEIPLQPGLLPDSSYGLEYSFGHGLMACGDNENLMYQNVDNDTRAILNAIGWGADRIGFKHDWTGEDLSYTLVNGKISNWSGKWSSKEFTLESKNPLTVKESSLSLYYNMADGSGYRKAQTSTAYPWQFEYPTEEERSQCELNVYGSIYAYFSGYAIVENEAGEELRLPLSYRASIGRAPKIIDAKVVGMDPYLSCLTVISGGTHAGIELLKDGKILTAYDNHYPGQFVEYFILPAFINNEILFSDTKVEYPVDIRISVTNGYGSDEKIINIPSADFLGVETVVNNSLSWDHVEYYSVGGQYLGTSPSADSLDNYPAGLYILLYKSGNDIVKREKVCK